MSDSLFAKSDHIIPVKLNGPNYYVWANLMENYIMGCELWGLIDGSEKDSSDGKWMIKNAKVKTWILSSVDEGFMVNLAPLKTAKEMWDYLSLLHNESSQVRYYQLEQEAMKMEQGTRSVREFYSAMIRIWNELDLLEQGDIDAAALPSVQKLRARRRMHHFLMKLRSEFEHTRSALLNHKGVTTLDEIYSELLAEETRLKSLSPPITTEIAMAAVDKGKTPYHNLECFHCKGKEHIAANYRSKLRCNYCKKDGHKIEDCRIRPQYRNVKAPPHIAAHADFTSDASFISRSSASGVVNPELMQSIIQALAASGLSIGSSNGEGGWDRQEGRKTLLP